MGKEQGEIYQCPINTCLQEDKERVTERDDKIKVLGVKKSVDNLLLTK